MHHALKTTAFALAFIATAASAEGVRTERNMSLDLANQIAAHTVAACTASGYNVTATVVDRAGTVRAVQRADNAYRTRWRPAAEGLHLGLCQEHHAGHHGRLAKNPPRPTWARSPATCCWAAAYR